MHMFEQATQPAILYSTFVNAGTFNGPQYNSSVGQIREWHAHFESHFHKQGHLEYLRHQALPGALHDSREHYDRPRCYPNTRTEVLDTLDRWAVDANYSHRTRCFLLSGSLGAGKTAIALTITDEWHSQHRLAASVFLPPTGRSDAARIIPTVASQLALAFPQLSSHIERIIAEDPFILDKPLGVQMARLIVRPFQEASWDYPSSRSDFKVIVIDGLDGAVRDQQEILALFVNLLLADIPLPFILFITCRSGPPILPISSQLHPFRQIFHVVLDNLSSSADIELFIRSKLSDMKNKNGFRACSWWPSSAIVEKLVERSSGQFMYASAVVDYICSPFHNPERRLQLILGGSSEPFIGSESPFAMLDNRYQDVLQRIGKPPAIVMEILAWLLVYGLDRINPPTTIHPGEPIPITSPAGLEQMLTLEPYSVHNHMAGWHAVLEIPPSQRRLDPIRIRHLSFIDFLADASRSKEFFIDRRGANTWILKSLLRHTMTHRIPNLDLSLWPYQPMVREDAFVYHLRHARPTIELKNRLGDILGFNGEGCHHTQSPFQKILLRQAGPLGPLSRGTVQAIICFLQVGTQS